MQKKFLLPSLFVMALAGVTACSSDLDDLAAEQNVTDTTIGTTAADADLFPVEDNSPVLSTNKAMALRTLLTSKMMDMNRVLVMGETNITDEQWAEIKDFVDKELAAPTPQETYDNIFGWIRKNVEYAWDGDAWLDPYDVFVNRRCVCQGYANLLKTMLLTQEIPAFCVNGMLGSLGGHAWNYVYLGDHWVVSDPTNGPAYNMTDVTAYQNSLIPYRIDFNIYEDDDFAYTFDDAALNVTEVKRCDGDALTVPYSVGGYRVTAFNPKKPLPDNVHWLYMGRNIQSLGDDELPLYSVAPNVEGVFVAEKNAYIESYEGVVYKKNYKKPYYIPRSIKQIRLRAMKTLEKNTLYNLDKVETIIVADGTTTIESYAIEGCPNLKRVVVPATVTEMADDAIYRCGDGWVVERVATSIHNVTM